MIEYYDTRFKVHSKDIKATAEFPKNALVELTNGCNHSCVFCKSSNQIRKTTHLNIEIFTRFVEQACTLGLEEIGLYGTGEPFITKNLDDFVEIAKNAGVGRVYITTNGSLASLAKVQRCVEVGLDSIKFSINAGNRKDYKFVHGYDDFNKVVKNVREVYEWKTSNGLDLQLLGSCLCIPSLPHTELDHYKIFGGFFEDILYDPVMSQGGQIFDTPLNPDEMSGVFSSHPPLSDDAEVAPCNMLWNRYHLTAEGYLSSCCMDYDLDLVFGDLKSESLSDAWNNQAIRELRKRHISGDLSGTLCNQCLRNKKCDYEPITDVKSKKIEHLRFKKKENDLVSRILKARL
jgi:MoaA/NifB/PqqE/SkfB family radical SAM enzyme